MGREFELIAAIKRTLAPSQNAILGIGDDCAVWPRNEREVSLLSADMMVEGVHFLRSALSWAQIGQKAAATNLSDIAAMGGVPEAMLVSLGLDASVDEAMIEDFYRGMSAVNTLWDVEVIGGNITRSAQVVIGVTVLGRAAQDAVITRAGARSGDALCVTGSLGGSLRGKHASFVPRIAEAQWLVQHCRPSAMIDVSDGVAGDVRHILEQSHVSGAVIDTTALPFAEGLSNNAQEAVRHALCDGEDYELLFTVPQSHKSLLAQAPFMVSHIGYVTNDCTGLWLERNGQRELCTRQGYRH